MTRAFSRGDHVELAQALVKEIGTDVIGDLGCLHTYDEKRGIWKAVPIARQSLIVQSFAGSASGERAKPLSIHSGDVTGATRLAFDQRAEEGFFADAAVGVAFANGFARVTIDGVSLEEHSKEHRCRFALPFAYANERSDTWERFIRGLFRDDEDAQQKIDCLGEFFGAALLGLAPRYQRAIVAKGGGEQGKSTLAEIVTAAFPPDSTCSIPPQAMGQEYRRAMLAGKRLNVVNELPEAEIIASESFKAIVTGDPIEGRHIREAPFTFRPEAGHYFAANRLPGTNDQTEGFWRRLLVIEFNRSFKDDPERDPEIAAKIKREDLPSVVAWMLEGAARLMRQGGYTLPPSHDRAVKEWRCSSDQVALFLHECTEPDPEAKTRATELYASYRTWAVNAGHRNLVARNTFGTRMRGLKVEPQHTREGSFYRLKIDPMTLL